MRVIAHPVRLRIMGILRKLGPQNSTTLAERLGLNTGAIRRGPRPMRMVDICQRWLLVSNTCSTLPLSDSERESQQAE